MMLKNADFFEDLSPMLSSSWLPMFKSDYKPGDVIVKQGQTPTECYIILEGECSIRVGDSEKYSSL
jgi:CRP-like cAMP-binding protein